MGRGELCSNPEALASSLGTGSGAGPAGHHLGAVSVKRLSQISQPDDWDLTAWMTGRSPGVLGRRSGLVGICGGNVSPLLVANLGLSITFKSGRPAVLIEKRNPAFVVAIQGRMIFFPP